MRTTVLIVLRLHEFINAVLFNAFQVLLHTHIVIRPVPLINPVDLPARIFAALKTVFRFTIGDIHRTIAVLEQVCTFPVTRPASFALAVFQTIYIGQIPATYRTVHAAGSDEFFGYWNFIHLFLHKLLYCNAFLILHFHKIQSLCKAGDINSCSSISSCNIFQQLAMKVKDFNSGSRKR